MKKALDKEGVGGGGREQVCVCTCGGGGGVKPFSGRSKPVSERGLVWFGLVWFLLLWSDQARDEGLKKCKRINYHQVRQMATFKEQIKMGMFCKKKIGFLLRGLLSLFYLFS